MTQKYIKSLSGFNLPYVLIEGKEPYITYFHGSKSSKEATKSIFLQKFAADNGLGFFSFDLTAHGAADGDYDKDGSISLWKKDAESALSFLNKQTIVCASSMGFWLLMLNIEQFSGFVAGVVGISSGPDFTVDIENAIKQYPDLVKQNSDYIFFNTPDGFEHKFSRKLLEDGRKNTVLDKKIKYNGKIALIHGDKDVWVNWKKTIAIKDCFASDDVKVVIVKGGEHRMSREKDLKVIEQEILNLL